MNAPLEEVRVFRDPIHGYIHVRDSLIWQLIQTPEFQRLHRIHQLGGVMQVYHTAEHSRFAHSLGVYEIVRRMIEEIPGFAQSLSEKERLALMAAGLLHDIGHGPFSHLFERLCTPDHEERGCQLIEDPKGSLQPLLEEACPGLSELVCGILRHDPACKSLTALISGQLDADRMDYLLRDAYETGTSYGHYDLERILRTLRVENGVLCVKKSGMHSVEDYIMARYQMYWQVYLHPDAYGYELLIEQFAQRVRELGLQEGLLQGFADSAPSNEEFLLLDDCWMFAAIQSCLHHEDPLLARLAARIIHRRLPEWKNEVSSQERRNIEERVRQAGLQAEKEVFEARISVSDCLPYQEDKDRRIGVLLEDGSIVPLSQVSALTKGLLQVPASRHTRLYFPREIL